MTKRTYFDDSNFDEKKKTGFSTNISVLKKLATTKKLREILKNHIESETIPSVRKAWIEYFFEVKNREAH